MCNFFVFCSLEKNIIKRGEKMFLEIKNYSKEGKILNLDDIVLDIPLIYMILKRYSKINDLSNINKTGDDC